MRRREEEREKNKMVGVSKKRITHSVKKIKKICVKKERRSQIKKETFLDAIQETYEMVSMLEGFWTLSALERPLTCQVKKHFD